jgi:hypothetical protein
MAQSVIHQPRVAWDGARAFVYAAAGPDYDVFAGRVADLLGPEVRDALAETRERVLTAWVRTGGDRRATDVELGRWRVRLEDLLRTHPESTDAILDLITGTR